LCQSWGFYFVGTQGSDGIGSKDLQRAIEALSEDIDHERDQLTTDNFPRKAYITPLLLSGGVKWRLLQLLLARFCVMNLLIEEAQKVAKESDSKKYRRLWTLLQVQPTLLYPHERGDIFMKTAEILKVVPSEDLKTGIRGQFSRFCELLKASPNFHSSFGIVPLFCVLDDVQAITNMCPHDFLSENGDRHSIIREIYLHWKSVFDTHQMYLVLSGTRANAEELERTLSSSFLKGKSFREISDIGAFDQYEAQARYIKRYIPVCWTDPAWDAFLHRAWEWFRGR
jgi:hypothetical protein